MAENATAEWPRNMTNVQGIFVFAGPFIAFVLILIVFKYVWKVPPVKSAAIPGNSSYGAVGRKPSLLEEGEVAGDYEENWKSTFDFVFCAGMGLFLAFLLVLTMLTEPELFSKPMFWIMQLPKLGTMLAVSTIGGLICRYFCEVDQFGYILTNKSSKFKVNYTRKLQHFAAYMVPLVIKTDFHGPLALAWGDFFTLIGFLVLIKPVRESCSFFMLQFNSLDRPEDRPHTLKWIIAGNIVPGLVILLFFKWLFGDYGALTFIIVFITGIGDGLAEPVGITWGRHKYKTRGCFSSRKYTRSWEGSACVFLSGLLFPAMQYADFANFHQVLAAMLILPPTMAYAEAVAPHTMDTPVLMIGCGSILYAIVYLL